MKRLLFLALVFTVLGSMQALSLAPARPQNPGESDADYKAYLQQRDFAINTGGKPWPFPLK